MTAFTARASLLLSLAAATLLADPAWAAGPGAQTRAAALQALADCRAVADGVQRLACYDKAAATLDQAEAMGEIVIVDREQARTVRKQAFGFTLPSLSVFDRGEKPVEMDEIRLKIVAVHRGADGKWVFRLEGGHNWRQIDTGELSRPPKPGGEVTIKRAALGSYKLSTGGAAAIRVSRNQ